MSNLNDKLTHSGTAAASAVHDGVDKVKEAFSDLKGRVSQASENVGHKARETFSELKDKASQVGDDVNEKAHQLATDVGLKSDEALNRVGEKIAEAGTSMGQQIPRGGTFSKPLGAVAAQVKSGGDYLAHHGRDDFAHDLTSLIRKHPLQSVSMGVCVGVLLGISLSWKRQADTAHGERGQAQKQMTTTP